MAAMQRQQNDFAAFDSLGKSRKPTRWGDETPSTTVDGFATAITAPMTSEQLEAYVEVFRIEEITQALRYNAVAPTKRTRSASPPPQYDAFGRRTNTRRQRHLARLETERHRLVEHALNTIPDYRAPQGYRRPTILRDKLYVPATDYPGVNFIGQILGPRGQSLKSMNQESGANIFLRGKGSVKEGRGSRVTHSVSANESQEPLHCLVTAATQHKIDRAKKLINEAIETAASTSEHENDRKRNQLRDLAMINGTFRDDEGTNLKSQSLRLNTDPGQDNREKQQPRNTGDLTTSYANFDHEFNQLMADIQDVNTVSTTHMPQQTETIPPWRIDRKRQLARQMRNFN
ncbi:hypothetical protein S40285_06403 [Stachybotrys chlorohalonatus IBT 40285]|uniref:Branchpoint-bridging protein n=1 Tax=Stachybotrys chlorohalonatus (strain IBT 40285) TaxID=1283841 RepID=A0A084QGF3_STAC4|nr:hypothetical protein S40285_06403 [Stachybotrys chlorohalonata IBT 40285]